MLRRLVIIAALVLAASAAAAERTIRITVLGVSLVAGFRISQDDAFPQNSERIVKKKDFTLGSSMPASPAIQPLVGLLDWIGPFPRALTRSSLSLAPMMCGVPFLHQLRTQPYKK